MSRTPVDIAVSFGVGIAAHLTSRRPDFEQLLKPITPTKYLVLVTPEGSA